MLSISNTYNKKAIVGHSYTITNKELDLYCKKIKKYNPYAISLLYPERYYGIDDALVDFFSVPKKSEIPVLVHEQKLVSGFDGSLINWPEDLLIKIFKDKNVIAVKEDSKNDEITSIVMRLSKEFNFDMIVAGGGKKRVRKLINEIDLKCWLNGSLMLFPEASKKVINAYLNQDEIFTNWYEQNIEEPYFNEVISKLGWHVGHKLALHLLGYCELEERGPLPVCPTNKVDHYKKIVFKILGHFKSIPLYN